MDTVVYFKSIPSINYDSPEVVKALDKIRFELQDKDVDEYGEFCWFAREYPRCYRYHIDCARYRLQSINEKYIEAKEYFEKNLKDKSENCFGSSYSSLSVEAIYWDFESLLSSINTALDILARIVGVAFKEQTPPSFNKLCKKELGILTDTFRKAQKTWVSRMKDYRDCFVHYTPVDTMLYISADLYKDGWYIRCKLPTNPNSRDILGFRYSRKVELLNYACTIYKHMMALDKSIAKEIKLLYKKNEFPIRKTNLFFLGVRD